MKMFYYQKNGIDCGTPDTLTVSTPEISLSVKSVSIFPNPTKNYFDVMIENPNKSLEFNIFNIDGTLIDSGEWTQELNRYNCVDFKPGVYMIQAQINNKSVNYKLIVE